MKTHRGREIRAEGTPARGPITLEAEVMIVAAAGDGADGLPKFRLLAYTGGLLRGLPGFGDTPVVVALDGMTIPSQTRPVRHRHEPREGVGHTTRIAIEGDKLVAEGVVSRDTAVAREIVASARNGFPWQASMGASTDELEFVERDTTVTVNGRTFKGPLYVARKTRLNEISFVDLGADSRARARIAAEGTGDGGNEPAGSGGGANGSPGRPTPAGVDDLDTITANARAETARRQAIRVTVAEVLAEQPDLVDDVERLARSAITAGWSAQQFQLEAMRTSRLHAGVAGPRRSDRELAGDVIEAALCMAGGMERERLEAAFDEPTLDTAQRRYRHGLGLCETLLIFAQHNGFRGHGRSDLKGLLQAAFHGDIQAAGLSTLSLPGILSNVANKFLRAGFDAVENTWRQVAATRPARDFKQITSYSLTGGFVYEQLPPGGELTHATVGEEQYTNRVDTYGRIFGIDRRDLVNDDLDALTAVPRRMGRGGALKLNDVFWAAFLDNAAFFTTARKNYAEGAGTALGIDALTQAEQLFLDQVDPDGHPMAVAPVILLVPNGLYVTATQLMQSTELRDTTANKKSATSNPHAGKFRPVRSSYLSNAKYTGNSTLAWYLLADPEDMPVIEVAFLNGMQEPTVESADADFNTLGIQMRGYHDFGVALQEYRGGAKMKGEA